MRKRRDNLWLSQTAADVQLPEAGSPLKSAPVGGQAGGRGEQEKDK